MHDSANLKSQKKNARSTSFMTNAAQTGARDYIGEAARATQTNRYWADRGRRLRGLRDCAPRAPPATVRLIAETEVHNFARRRRLTYKTQSATLRKQRISPAINKCMPSTRSDRNRASMDRIQFYTWSGYIDEIMY